MIAIVHERIDVPQVLHSVRSETAGGVVHFLGTIRNDDGADQNGGLFYESHAKMAESVLRKIADEAQRRWPLERVSVVHRIGWIPVGEEAVVVAVSSAHRAEAFEACRFLIDRIKEEAPIWKVSDSERVSPKLDLVHLGLRSER